MQLRLATLQDVPAIVALVRAVVPAMNAAGNYQWTDSYPNAEVFEQDIANRELWVAQPDPHLAGQPGSPLAAVAAFTAEQEPEYAQLGWNLDEPALVIHRLAVAPAFQGQGLAAALMQHAEVVGRALGAVALRVDTGIDNPVTQRLFPRLGYTFAGEISLDAHPGLIVLCYEKRLTPSV